MKMDEFKDLVKGRVKDIRNGGGCEPSDECNGDCSNCNDQIDQIAKKLTEDGIKTNICLERIIEVPGKKSSEAKIVMYSRALIGYRWCKAVMEDIKKELTPSERKFVDMLKKSIRRGTTEDLKLSVNKDKLVKEPGD